MRFGRKTSVLWAFWDGSSLLDSDGRFRIEDARRAVEGRLHLLPRFRQVLCVPGRGLAGPLWVRVIGQDRTLAVMRSSLELVSEVAHGHDAKVNDGLLAVIAGGLRGLLLRGGEHIERVILPILCLFSLRLNCFN